MSSPPTLQDIADHAGVSRMTVSRALRNEPRCSPETRERIQKIAKEMGYRPNPLVVARMQQMRQRHPSRDTCLAVVQPGEVGSGLKDNENSRQWYAGITQRAEELGFRTELVNLPTRADAAKAVIRTLAYRQVEGLCFLPFPKWGWNFDLDLRQFSMAAIGFTLLEPHIHRVASDHREGLSIALAKLKELGYRRVGLVLEENTSSRVDHQHLEIFLRHHLFDQDIYPVSPLIIEVKSTPKTQARRFQQWRKAEQPDVLISNLDSLSFIKGLKIGVPEEIGFISLDVQANHPSICGIDQQPRRVGACLTDRVVSQIYCNQRGIPEYPELTLAPPKWKDGDSLRPQA
ncbi:LacI family DNA-binding transcriptional regulator [Cerasicoccus fimbriatus]|uniref:LacI family DNA-binding transcriptional regulator n=1 Tax=Cerasicoccus fimbriatus TaxID=3014554 RepID=UPI0022B55E4A|nr:LacI family DNA-binding transcriptional regulator [Cerasicoccus sp. TK19100]